MSEVGGDEWWSWYAGSGGVDAFECVLTSWIGRPVVAPALAGMQCAARSALIAQRKTVVAVEWR